MSRVTPRRDGVRRMGVTTTYDLHGHLLSEVDTDAADHLDGLGGRLAQRPPMAREWHKVWHEPDCDLGSPSLRLVNGTHQPLQRGVFGSTL